MVSISGNQSLKVKLAAPVITSQLTIVVSFTETSFPPKPSEDRSDSIASQTDGIKDVVILPSDEIFTKMRHLNSLSIKNSDTAIATVFIVFFNGTVPYGIASWTLAVGDTTFYEKGDGWKTIDSSGAIKSMIISVSMGIMDINGDATASQTLTTGVSGTNFAILDDGIGGHVFNLPVASSSNTGKLSNTDWITFNNKVTSVSGTFGRITSTGGTTPVIDISGTYVGQTSITTLGTIAIGTWNSTKINLAYGGTNADLSATGGAGQYLKQSSAGAAVSVGLIPASDIGSGAALTKVDDTNVTLTLVGAPGSSLLQAVSLSLGWTGSLSIARGGRNNTSAVSNGIDYFDGTKFTTSVSFVYDGTSVGIGAIPDSLLTVSKQTFIIAPPIGTAVHLIGLDANSLRVTLDTHNNAGAGGTALLGRRSRGTAITPSATLAGDTVISMNGVGFGTTGFGAISTGLITIKANENFTDTAQGTYVTVFTTPDGSVTAAEAFRITGAGVINAIQAGGKYQINSADVLTSTTLGSTVINSSIKTLGTVTVGVWNGTNIAVANGGTGASTSASARSNLGIAVPLIFGHASTNPADAAVMLIGGVYAAAANVGASVARYRLEAPVTGQVTRVRVTMNMTVGTTETGTLKLNNKTAGTSVTLDAAFVFNNTIKLYTGLTFAVTLGDELEIEEDCPTWVTNPTSVSQTFQALINC